MACFPAHLPRVILESKMFCCCIPIFRICGLKKAQSEKPLCHCRHQLGPHLRSCWSFGRRRSQSFTQDIFEELVHGFNYCSTLDKCQVQKDTKNQCCSEESTLSLDEACTMLKLKEGTMEDSVQSLLQSPFQDRNTSNITTIFCIYQVFPMAQLVLGQQFKNTLSPILSTWPDQKLQDTWQSLNFTSFKVKTAYVDMKLHDWNLKNHTALILVHQETLEPTEAESDVPAPGLLPVAEPEKGSTMELETAPVMFQPSSQVSEPASPPSAVPELEQVLTSSSAYVPGPQLQSAQSSALLRILTPALKIETEPTPVPEPSCHWHVTPKNQLNEEKPSLMDFPPKLVAEQLTYIDAELFKKVLPHQCLGSIWSKRNKPGNEHLAPTVCATVTQFNSVVNCVITTCLGNPRMIAQDRAMVVEHWIKVAKACQIMRNYSSLHAILSALQSASIYRLKKTWERVSRKSFQKFKKLCTEDNPQRRELLLKEWPSKWATLMMSLQRAQKRLQKKGVVPFLGTFLTDMVMLDTAMKDYLKEYKVMKEIMLLQVAADNYTLEPKEEFRACFQAVERLSEDESYILSCQLEPQS
ncbi:ral guanine nucleotide dissociation stimulator-like isoform X2 [Acinonyx jubatus]|uniref:Ral guanine nucleotide dissociation stimulator-like isoform X2 n=1 Tax=Acinonyx jubatus TaxID=32536 RepID=A0ABM3PE31_ACIJB|nr:ral guanine nucleotide dissociation stimulator-like isoform X2 [Acinonyx jubatus]